MGRDAMLGRLIMLVVTIPSKWLGTLCGLAGKLASREGDKWGEQLLRFLRQESTWVRTPETHPDGHYRRVEVWEPNSPLAPPPLCEDCGNAMTRTGTCWNCSNCGATSGC